MGSPRCNGRIDTVACLGDSKEKFIKRPRDRPSILQEGEIVGRKWTFQITTTLLEHPDTELEFFTVFS